MQRSWLGLLCGVLTACGGGAPAKQAPAPEPAATETDLQLAMVLLREAKLPAVEPLIAAHAEIAGGGPGLTKPDATDSVLMFDHGGARVMIALMPAPVPGDEAEYHAAFSVNGIVDGWKPPPHVAHLLVTRTGGTGAPIDRVRELIRVTAAVTETSPSVGVYYGDGGVTHEPHAFVDFVREDEDPMIVWSGVSVAGEGDRLSLLSTGMKQFELPEIELRAPRAKADRALAMLYDVMLYVVKRGEALPEGDTVGPDATTRYPVTYAPSPVDPSARVMLVEMP